MNPRLCVKTLAIWGGQLLPLGMDTGSKVFLTGANSFHVSQIGELMSLCLGGDCLGSSPRFEM